MNVDVRAHRAAADAHATAPDVDTQHRFTDLQQLAQRRRRTHAVSLAIVALAAVAAVSLVATNRDGDGITSPISPDPAVSTTPPTPTDWFPPQEPGSTSVVPDEGEWVDPRDTAVNSIDLTRVQTAKNGGSWDLNLAAAPQRPRGVEAGTTVSYGVVLDATRDGTADFLVGIANDAPRPTGTGGYRTWVTDLTTNETDEQVGPPYGFPVEFSTNLGRNDQPPTVRLWFIQAQPPLAFDMNLKTARIYAWSSVARDGEVIAWDTAPDTGWMNGP